MNSYFLKGHMDKHGDNMESLAKALGLHSGTLYIKMHGGSGKRVAQFTQGEIKAIAERYKLTPDDIAAIFFS